MATRNTPALASIVGRPRSLKPILVAAAFALTLGTLTACSPPTTPPAGGETVPPATAVTTVATTPTDPTAAWTRYSDAVDHFSLRYPPTWQQRTCPGSDHTALFLAPTTDALAICNSGFVGQMSVAAVPGDQRSGYQVDGTDAVSTLVTIDGVTGTHEWANATATDLGPPVGTHVVAYLFYTGGMTYRLSYAQAPTGATSTDVLADFELMATHTFRFSA
jgi:hypothetical protein